MKRKPLIPLLVPKPNRLRALYIVGKRKLGKMNDEKLIVLLSAAVFLLQFVIQVTAVHGQERPAIVYGRVMDERGAPLPGASVKIQASGITTLTDTNGEFKLSGASTADMLVVTFLGYKQRVVPVTWDKLPLMIRMQLNALDMQEVVVSTGFQTVPLERATGSFVQLDSVLLNRRVGKNILERLEGVTSGLIFNRNTLAPNEKTGISIRGRSSIDNNVSPEPLIVVDNFPYDGNIENLNPNDVESVTILKDAAAASIWGARAGNGVIVITTRKGKLNAPLKVQINSNVTTGGKPNLFYSQDYISAPDFIETERFLFDRGYFNADLNNTVNRPMISPAVEIFAKVRGGELTSAEAAGMLAGLKQTDARNDFDRYVYRESVNQQYTVNLSGGSAHGAYRLSAGLDQNHDNIVRNGNRRYTIHSNNIFTPLKNIEVKAGLSYYETHLENNGSGVQFGNVFSGGRYGLYPYARLADENGNPLAIEKDYRASYVESSVAGGFLDWHYRPLDEMRLADMSTRVHDLLLRGGVKYRFSTALAAELQYQYEHQQTGSRNYRSNETYYTRNLINQFTQRNPATGLLSYAFPNGGILDLNQADLRSYNLRGQINYNKDWGGKYSLNGIVGAELRQSGTDSFVRTSYGYDDDLGTAVTNLNYETTLPRNPAGSGRISAPAGFVGGALNRYISYYANGAFTYLDRYTLSVSGRKDGANIFGVKTNDKITPLWSAGLGWEVHKEPFFKTDMLDRLRVRATYGFNGNVYNASAYLTARYSTSSLTGLRYATVASPPNPELRWERIRNINAAVDFAVPKDVLSGTIEVYQKDGLDLIESALLAPSTGFRNFKGNAASTRTKGIDITLGSLILNRGLKWRSNLLVSQVKDKITHFDTKYQSAFLAGINVAANTPEEAGLLAVEGKSMFGLYSFRWAGLDGATGDPLGYYNGEMSNDYLNIITGTSPEDLVYHGSSRPTVFGGFRNDLSWKRFSLSANLTYKLNYYFRRRSTSLNYQDNLNSNAHSDFSKAWKQPGDEQFTSVPSIVYPANNNRSFFYRASEILVEKGDHLRLQDINVSYSLDKQSWKRLPVQKVTLYLYANNLGLIWKANKAGLDPDFLNRYAYPNPKTYSIGLNVNL